MNNRKEWGWTPPPSVKPTRGPSALSGDRGAVNETHPAYGAVHVTFTNGGNDVLFGSKVRNMPGYVKLKISRATRELSFGQERVFGNELNPLIEVAMTHAQFVAMITQTNRGSGTPVTLRLIRKDDGSYDRVPYIDPSDDPTEVAASARTLRERGEELAKQVDALKGQVLDAIGGHMSQKKRDEIGKIIDKLAQEIGSNVPFYVSQAHESVENAVASAHVEVESAMATFHREIGAAMTDAALRRAIGSEEAPVPALLDVEEKE